MDTSVAVQTGTPEQRTHLVIITGLQNKRQAAIPQAPEENCSLQRAKVN